MSSAYALARSFSFVRGTVILIRGVPTAAAGDFYYDWLGVSPSWLVELETNNPQEWPSSLNPHCSELNNIRWNNNPTGLHGHTDFNPYTL